MSNAFINELELDLFDYVMGDEEPELERFWKLANELHKEESEWDE